jgi:hypothetical protein
MAVSFSSFGVDMISMVPSASTTTFSSVNATDLVRDPLREAGWSWGKGLVREGVEDFDSRLARW